MIFSLAACFTPEAEPLVVETVKFENLHTQHPNLLLQPFTYPGLACPDGQDATFYGIYQDALTEPAPVVMVFHAGAFDYVEAQDLDADGKKNDVLPPDDENAPHYAGENRLSSAWASNKVFETLGILKSDATESSEVNTGALPAALADAGTFAIYPANCWGDLGHNESGIHQNDADYESGVKREGLALHWMISLGASPDQVAATEAIDTLGLNAVPIPLDWTKGIYYVGLAEGGRAIAEILHRPNSAEDTAPVRGILIDSTMDNLGPLAKDDTNFRPENDGLARIFPDYEDIDGDNVTRGDVATCNGVSYRDDIECPIAAYSLWWYFQDDKTPVNYPISVWYSSADPRVPTTTLDGLLALEADNPNVAAALDIHDVGTPTHVQLNDEIEDARRAVDTLLTPLTTQ